MFEWLSHINVQAAIIGPIISAFIGGFHYWLNQHCAKKVRLSKLIQGIEGISISHWCSSGGDNNNKYRVIRIQRSLHTLSWRINKEKYKVGKALIEYRQAITGDDFSEPHRRPEEYENIRVQLITSKAKNLRKALKIKKHH